MPPRRITSDQTARAVQEGVRVFLGLPRPFQVAAVVLVVAAAAAWLLISWLPRHVDSGPGSQPPVTGANPDGSGSYLFCFWNVENLFDDHRDRRRSADEPYDNWFAANPADRELKYDHLAHALLAMNSGSGPDIIACAEVESTRAAELLRDALNAKLDTAEAAPSLRYTYLAMKDLDAGRHIAPCVISRVPIREGRTRLHGSQLRILETHLTANGADLCVVASHWTSQLPQRDGGHGEGGREKYATAIHDFYTTEVRKNPATDFLVCGDFNDTPDAVVGPLHAASDPAGATAGAANPLLIDLMAGKDPKQFGTIWHNGKPFIYDQICVSPGLLDDAGWRCDPSSVATVTEGLTQRGATRREPWRFGNTNSPPTGGRGYSDHFPVTVRLNVKAPAAHPPPPE